MKTILYNDYYSLVLLMLTTFFLSFAMYVVFPFMTLYFPLLLIYYYYKVIKEDKMSGWYKRLKVLPIKIEEIYFGKTVGFIIYWLYIMSIMFFFQIFVKGFDFTQVFGTASFSYGLTFIDLIYSNLFFLSLVLILFSIDILLNYGIFRERKDPINIGLPIFIGTLLLSYLIRDNNIDFEKIAGLTSKINLTESGFAIIFFLLSLGFNVLVNLYLMKKYH